MKILSTKVAEHCDSGTTANVIIYNRNNERLSIYVQTIEGLYDKDLGCSISTYDGKPLDEDYFDDYTNDINQVIAVAERYIMSTYKIMGIQSYVDYVFKVFDNRVILAVFDSILINTSIPIYKNIREFDNIEEAKTFIKNRLEIK